MNRYNISRERLEEILGELLFWASEVINDGEELEYAARNSWGLTEEEIQELELKEDQD